MATTYQRTSPYYYTPQTSRYLGYWKPPSVMSDPSDILIQITSRYQNRPDLLSYDLYGTPRLWWIFAMRNPDQIRDPIWDMTGGLQIYVPSGTVAQGYL